MESNITGIVQHKKASAEKIHLLLSSTWNYPYGGGEHTSSSTWEILPTQRLKITHSGAWVTVWA